MSDKDVKINLNKNVDSSEVEQSAESVAADTAKANAELAKLTADLEELRQTLLRRQADFGAAERAGRNLSAFAAA